MFPKQPPAAVSSVIPVCILYMPGQEKDRRLFLAISHLFLKGTETIFSGTILDLFLGVFLHCVLELDAHSHSVFIPILRHFLNRQNWQRLRWCLLMTQSCLLRQL